MSSSPSLALLLAFAALACNRSPASASKQESSCRRELGKDELYRLQDRIGRGENVCPELTAPRVEVDRSGVRLDGQALAGKLPDATLEKFSPLFDALKAGRETWKMLNPAKPFEPTVTLIVAPDVTAFAGASVVRSAVFTGHRHFQVRAGGIELDFDHSLPSTEPPSDLPDSRPPERLRVARAPNGNVRVRFSGRISPRVGLDEIVVESELGRMLASECEKGSEPCIDEIVVEVGSGSFVELADLARGALRAPPLRSRRVPLAFELPESNALPAEPSTDPPKASKARVRFGLLHVQGPLAQELVEGVVKRAEPRFRGCYERGLANNPHLQGRVSARFVIGRDGAVHETRNGGSDLPDSRVVECVLATYGKLRFPKPERTIASVVSPLLFTPD